MQYQIDHVCGHTVTHQLFGKMRDREQKIAWLKRQPCLDCLRAQEYTEAQEYANQVGLPDLVGSDKQVAWAMTIRHQAVQRLDEYRVRLTGQITQAADRQFPDPTERETRMATAFAQLENQITAIRARTSAKYWIDRREYSANQFVSEQIDHAQKEQHDAES
jgi:hypothetical protein